MSDRETIRREQAAVLAVVEGFQGPWYLAADLIEAAGGALALLSGSRTGLDTDELAQADQVARAVSDEAVDRWVAFLDERLGVGDVDLVTVSDDHYPVNLRTVFNRPPFLFLRGRITEADRRAIAVVGTRQASPEGLALARKIASELSEANVTVVSGLARGIDGAAHTEVAPV